MNITNATMLRKKLSSSLESVIDFNEPITVVISKGNAVIISEEEYKSMLETINLISQPGLVEKIKEGEKEERSTMKAFRLNEEW